jgi:hypothetical protein
MLLAKALKKKNQLAGEIRRLETLITNENVKTGTNVSHFNVDGLYVALELTHAALWEYKAAIARANVPIALQMAKQSELKAQIAFLRGLDVHEGLEPPTVSFRGTTGEPVLYKATLTKRFVEDKVVSLEQEIEKIQDELDAFNATTSIEG